MENVEIKYNFDQDEYLHYLNGEKCVLYKGVLNSWNACSLWDIDYFETMCPDVAVSTKFFTAGKVEVISESLPLYVKRYREYLVNRNSDHGSVPYCHDVPIFLQQKELINDIGDMPGDVFPDFYRKNWWRYVQFFMSPMGAITPLHFDTLRTNNLFFQIRGEKVFSLIRWRDRKKCVRKGWRWFEFNPDSALENRDISISRVNVEQGDMLFMPAGTLHHVKSLSECISFNVDFHTKLSVIKSFGEIHKSPNINNYYNFLMFCGLHFGINDSKLFSRYESYLNYCS